MAVTITPGKRGEFTVWVDGTVVASKSMDAFPSEDECLVAVQAAL